jgi:hypothetical protein
MGFKRHIKQQKRFINEWATQIVLGCPWPEAFFVDQEYSLTGCSPAEPVSACPDSINIIPTFEFEQKSYPHVLGFR